MKKYFAIIIILAALYKPVSGQKIDANYDIKWGAEEKVSSRETLADIVGYDETGFYALNLISKINIGIGLFNRYRSFYLQHYNNDVKVDRTSMIDLDKKVLEEIVQLKDNLYLFSSLSENNDKNNFLFVNKIDKQNLKIGPEQIEIANIDFKGNSKRNDGVFMFHVSEDKSKLLVLCLLPYEKDESEKFAMKVYDENMEQLWSKEIELPYSDQHFDVKDYHIDNSGNVYVLGKVYHERDKSKAGGLPNYHYAILAYKNKGGSFKEYDVSLQDKFLQEMKISVTDLGDIICAGFYSHDNRSGIKGSYYLTVDGETNDIKHKSFNEFEIEFMVQSLGLNRQKKLTKDADKGKNVEIYNYDLRDLVLKDGGGAVLVAEQYYYKVFTSTTTSSTGMRTTSYTRYYYNDIIVVNIDKQGDIVWTKKIPKRQVTTNDGGYFLSYTMAVVRDRLFFVYNDNIKNLSKKLDERPDYVESRKSVVVVLAELKMDGTINREALFTAKETGSIARPKVCEQVSNDELVIFCDLYKKQRFAILGFDLGKDYFW